MTETKGVRKGINDQLDILERRAYEAGYAKGIADTVRSDEAVLLDGAKAMHDAFITISHYNEQDKDGMEFADLMSYLLTRCPKDILAIAERIRSGEFEEAEEKYVPTVGDRVKDCSGRECKITNTDTHVHVLYNDGKTHKWKKSDEFVLVAKGNGSIAVVTAEPIDERDYIPFEEM